MIQTWVKRFAILGGICVLLVAFQNCHPNRLGFSKDSNRHESSIGGDGAGYEGKLGTYDRVIPDYKCGPDFALVGTIIVTGSTARVESLDSATCSLTSRLISTNELSFSFHKFGFVGFAEGLFVKRELPVVLTTRDAEVPEAWCRDPEQTLEISVGVNYVNGASRATLRKSVGENQIEIGLRSTAGRTRSYSGQGFSLVIDSASKTASGEANAVLDQVTNGAAVRSDLLCRLGAVVDEIAPTSSQPLPPPVLSPNLLTSSTQFDSVDWSKTGGQVTANSVSVPAPDGSLSADLFREDNGNSYHIVTSAPVTANPGAVMTFSVFVKPLGAPNFYLKLQDTLGIDYIYCAYFPATGNVIPLMQGTGSGTQCSVQTYPDGWYRLALTGVPSTTRSNFNAEVYLYKTGSLSYQGDGTGAALLWGAQLQPGPTATLFAP